MSKGVNIPLKISGLREARENLEALNKEFEELKKDDPKGKINEVTAAFNKQAKEIHELETELQGLQKAGQLVGVKFDDLNEVIAGTSHEVLPLSSQIGEMEDRLYQLAKAGDTSSAEFKALQAEIVRNRMTIIETDRAIDSMVDNAGSIGGITSAFGELGDSVLSLDFKRAGTALKGLGTQFKAFGATLLANPIFLIVAVIAAVVTAVVMLKDKVKILGVVFDAVGKAIGWVVQQLKDFLDWIGLTSFAADEASKKAQENAEKEIENEKAKSEARQASFDRAIALAQAEGKSTVNLEIQKQKAIIATSQAQKAQLRIITEQLRLQGELTDEKTKEIVAQRKAYEEAIKNAANQIKIIEINAAKEVKDKEKESLDKRKEAYENYTKARMEAARLLQDLEVDLMAEGRDKLLLQNEITYQRLIEDTLKNETLLQEEKDKLIGFYNQLEAQNKQDILLNNLEKELDINHEYEDRVKESMQRITTFSASEASKREARSKEEKEQLISDIQDYASGVVGSLGSVNGFLNQISENRLKNVEEGSKKEEKIRKQMFARQKALSLAMAAIDGFKAITASLAQSPIAIGPVPNPAGIASLAFAITTTAAQIAAIAAQTFDGGAKTPSVGGANIGGGGATSSSSSTPSFELFGQANEGNNVSAPQSQETTQMTVKAVVVESDITSTQNKINKIQKSAEL